MCKQTDDFDKMLGEDGDADLRGIHFVETRTQMLLVKSTSSFLISHANREEEVEEGQMFGFDVSKKGDGEEEEITLLLTDKGVVVRRIGFEAWKDSGWEEVPSLASSMEGVVAKLQNEVESKIEETENESYKEAFLRFKESLSLGNVPAVFHQACGIKVCIGLASMEDEIKRDLYSKLLSESNGKPSTNKPFDASHSKRMIVCETLPVGGGGGFPIDDLGQASPEGNFRGTSVYQKPESHVSVDWKPVSREEAISKLRRHNKTLPWHHIKTILRKMKEIEG